MTRMPFGPPALRPTAASSTLCGSELRAQAPHQGCTGAMRRVNQEPTEKEIHVYQRPTIITSLDATVVLAEALGWDHTGSSCGTEGGDD